MTKTEFSPGPFHADPFRDHFVCDADGKPIGTALLSGVGSEKARGNANLFAQSWAMNDLISQAYARASLEAIALRQVAVPGKQSEADAIEAEAWAEQLRSQLARNLGRE